MANSAISQSREQREIGKGASSSRLEIITVSWTADDANGTIPTLSMVLDGWLLKAVTNPGSTAPTANYDIVLQDPQDSSLDALDSLLLNRHTSTTQQVYTNISGAVVPVLLAGTYTLSISGNSVNSATGVIVFYLTDTL